MCENERFVFNLQVTVSKITAFVKFRSHLAGHIEQGSFCKITFLHVGEEDQCPPDVLIRKRRDIIMK